MAILRSPSTIQAGGRHDRSDMPLGLSVGIASTTASLASILWLLARRLWSAAGQRSSMTTPGEESANVVKVDWGTVELPTVRALRDAENAHRASLQNTGSGA
jgi:hypothetical protein